jgi:precorrin-2 dehydrogenase/sirohydrochlorin ferrochelatase
MAVFPMFVDLRAKKCIIVGGGEIASRKAEILLKFEPKLTIIAPEINDRLKELSHQDKLDILIKEYSERDMESACLAVAATSSLEVNARVYQDALRKNVPVNVVDDPQKCTFLFPSVVLRGDLSIGISTSGTYPALSKKVRKIAEEVFHEEYSEILKLLSAYRLKLRASSLDRKQREKRLVKVLEELYDNGDISAQAILNILEEHEKQFAEDNAADGK